MSNTDITNIWIAPLLVTIIGSIIAGLVVFFVTNRKNSDKKEKEKYLYNLLNCIDNNFQKCIDIYIYNQKQLDENLNTLDNAITNIYILSTESPPLTNIDNDKYYISKIIESARNLNSILSETKNDFLQVTQKNKKIELLNKLRNSLLIFCYNTKPDIYKSLETLYQNDSKRKKEI